MSEILLINYSPIRIGFLVNKGNIQELIKSVQLNNIFVGGELNPIIPIEASSENLLAKKLVKIFGIDLFFSISDEFDAIKNFVKNYNHLSPPFNLTRPLVNYGDYYETGILDIFTLLKKYYKDLKGVENLKSKFALVNWDDNDKHSNIFNLIYGKFSTDYNFRYNYKKAFEIWLKAKEFKIDNKEDSILDPNIENNYITPLGFTHYDLNEIRYNLMILNEGFYFGDANNFDDLVNFWNLKAISLNIKFIPFDDVKRFKKIIKTHHKYLTDKNKIIGLTERAIFYKGVSSVVRKLKNSIKELKDYREISLENILYWNTFLKGWHSVYFNKSNQTILANLESSKNNKVKLRFTLPEKLITSKDYYKPEVDQYISVFIGREHLSELSDFTLIFPNNKEFNNLIGKKVYPYDPNALRLVEEGFKLIINCKRNILDINTVSKEEILNNLFSFSGMKISLSNPGYKAKLIISKLGGLQNCEIFKLNKLRNLFSKLIQEEEDQKDKVQNLSNILTIDKIIENISKDKKECCLKKLSKNLDITENNIFNFLIENELLLGGYSVKCPNCNTSYWIPISRTENNIKCDYCSYNFKLINNLIGKKREFSYRVNGIFSRREKDEGSLITILTMLQLYKFFIISNKDVYLMPSIKIKNEKIECEIDTVLLIIGSNREVNLLIGECKNKKEINRTDILNLIKIKKKFKEKNLNTSFIFSKCSKSFSDNEKYLINRLIKFGVNIVILNKKELTSEDIYSNYQKEELKDTSRTIYALFKNSKSFIQI